MGQMRPAGKSMIPGKKTHPRKSKRSDGDQELNTCAHRSDAKLDAREQSVYDALLPVLRIYSFFDGDPLEFPVDSLERDVRAAIVSALAGHRSRVVSEIIGDFGFGDSDTDFIRFVQSLTVDDLEMVETTWTDAVVASIVEGAKRSLVFGHPGAFERFLTSDVKLKMWSIDATTSLFGHAFKKIGVTVAKKAVGKIPGIPGKTVGKPPVAQPEKSDKVMAVTWISERDEKVCEKCTQLDDRIVGIQGSILISPGLHPWCRCRVKYEMMTKIDFQKSNPLTIGDVKEIAGTLRGGY